MSKTKHNPRYIYDCERCKFNWCCGYTCACILEKPPRLPEPPIDIKIAVDTALIEVNLKPHYKLKRR